MTLQLACVLHGEDSFLVGQIVLAEDIEAVFIEIAVESGTYLADLAFDDASQRLGERPVFIFEVSDISSVLKTITVSGLQYLIYFFPVFLLDW